MHINYTDIGNQIRYERKKKNITQERLAELCNISIPHMSNIENARTKVSLPVLVDIANVLGCTVDRLLCNSLQNNNAISNSIIYDVLSDCNNEQKEVVMDTIFALKEALNKHGEK